MPRTQHRQAKSGQGQAVNLLLETFPRPEYGRVLTRRMLAGLLLGMRDVLRAMSVVPGRMTGLSIGIIIKTTYR